MTTKLPTKAQVVEAFYSGLMKCDVIPVGGMTGDATFNNAINVLASILVRAGLAEEPREYLPPGLYQVRWWLNGPWTAADKLDDGRWAAIGMDDRTDQQPHTIGPRIHPPKE